MATEDNANGGKRRRLLLGATTAAGAVGVIASAVPFLTSLWPSARVQAAGAPVDHDISRLQPGQQDITVWRGKIIWVINRTKVMLDDIPKLDGRVRDPKSEVDHQPIYCKNEFRSIKPEIFVAIGICTHLGLLADVPSRDRAAGSRPRLAWRLLLSMPSIQVRSRRPRVRWRARSHQPCHPAVPLRVRHVGSGRRGYEKAGMT